MLYCNICNIWCKNIIQISYKNFKILSTLFISCWSITSQIQLYNYEYSVVVIQKHVDTYYFNIF